jgi:hypothetical protein
MRKISSTIKSLIYVLIIAVTYYFRGYQANEHYGYRQLDVSAFYVFVLLLTVIFGSYLFGIKYKKPSDYFLLLYGMIVVIPYGVMHNLFNGGEVEIFANWVVILLPFLSVLALCNLELKLPKVSIVSPDKLLRFILALAAIVVVCLLVNPPSTASFSLLDSYTRRLEARDVYGGETLSAYMSGIVMNGVLPLIVFFGVLRRDAIYIAAGVLFYAGVYYIYGVKAPVMYMLFSGVFAYYLRRPNGSAIFYNSIYYIFVSMFVLAWVEFCLFDYSFVEDYLIRRIYYVGVYLVGAYFDALSMQDFSWAIGLAVEKSPSIYIGEDFLGLPGANANTNTFLYFLLQYGLPGYFFSIGLVSGFLFLLNSLRFRSDIFAYLSLMYAVLILEQSATTALLSSGVGVMFLLFYFSRNNKSCRPQLK